MLKPPGGAANWHCFVEQICQIKTKNKPKCCCCCGSIINSAPFGSGGYRDVRWFWCPNISASSSAGPQRRLTSAFVCRMPQIDTGQCKTHVCCFGQHISLVYASFSPFRTLLLVAMNCWRMGSYVRWKVWIVCERSFSTNIITRHVPSRLCFGYGNLFSCASPWYGRCILMR